MANVSLVRHAAILIKYKVKRLFNTFSNLHNKKKVSTDRSATQPKATKAWILALVFSPLIVLTTFFQSHQIISKTIVVLDQKIVYADGKVKYPAWTCEEMDETFTVKKIKATCTPLQTKDTYEISSITRATLTLILLFTFIGVFMFGILEKNIAKSDWDFEWLNTLPMTKKNLILIKFLEQIVVNGFGLLLLLPIVATIAFYFHSIIPALLMTLLVYICLVSIVSMFQVFAQLGLKLFLPLSKLKNLQAILSLVSMVPLYFIFAIPTEQKPYLFTLGIGKQFSFDWSPFNLAINILTTTDSKALWMYSCILLLEVGIVYFVMSRMLQSLLLRGVSGLSHQETANKELSHEENPSQNFLSRWLTPLQMNELRLLWRDKSFMNRTLLLPILLIGFNIYNLSSGTKSLAFTSGLLSTLSAATLYSFVFSLLPILIVENQTFWLAKTFPLKLEDFFKQKIILWICISLIFPLGLAFYLIAAGAPLTLNTSFILLSMIAFTVIFAFIAGSFGIVGANTYNESTGFGSIKIIYTYFYMALMGAAISSVSKGEVWIILVTLLISYLTAKSLWQKVKEQSPYLLDSVAVPKALITALDGIIAVNVFFVLQLILSFFLLIFYSKSPEKIAYTAFAFAGFFTCLGAAIIYWKEKPRNFPRLINKNLSRSILYGVVGGLTAAVVGITYKNFIYDHNYFAEALEADNLKATLLVFTSLVICAPLFEEYIFRGILLNGLRENKKAIYSIVMSALLFAVVHPPVSFIPVFMLGILTAVAFELTGSLLASILIHAIYNFVIVSQAF